MRKVEPTPPGPGVLLIRKLEVDEEKGGGGEVYRLRLCRFLFLAFWCEMVKRLRRGVCFCCGCG